MSKKPAASLEGLNYIKGHPVSLEECKGKKVVVVEFWATWCPPCVATIPHLTKLAHKYKDQVEFIGVTSETDVTKVTNFVTGKGDQMDYNVAIDSKQLVSKGYMEEYGVSGIPHAFVIDKHGNVIWHDHPASDLDSILSTAVSETIVDVKSLTAADLKAMPAKELIKILLSHKVDASDCLEKQDYVDKILNEIVNK